MKNLVLLFVLTQRCLTFDLPRDSCKKDLSIGDENYHVAKTYDMGEVEPTDATYDDKGNLFFVILGQDMSGYYFNINLIKPNSTRALNIPGLPERESYAIALDKRAEKVYFGTTKGIYVYNYESQDATLVTNPDIRLNTLLVDKDGNKYITGSNDGVEQLYLLDGDKKILFRGFEAFDEVAVDTKNNFYYIHGEKLYVLKSNVTQARYIGNVTYEGLAQISFYEENVYVASETLSYFHENDTGPLKLVENTPSNLSAIAFDGSGSLVLGRKGKIVKYTINNKECYQRKNETK